MFKIMYQKKRNLDARAETRAASFEKEFVNF